MNLLLRASKSNPQEQNTAIQDLTRTFCKGLRKSDKIILYRYSIVIPVGKIFLKSLFESYICAVSGVNAGNIKDLMLVLDFNYLSR